jgi:hypothetical protein
MKNPHLGLPDIASHAVRQFAITTRTTLLLLTISSQPEKFRGRTTSIHAICSFERKDSLTVQNLKSNQLQKGTRAAATTQITIKQYH